MVLKEVYINIIVEVCQFLSFIKTLPNSFGNGETNFFLFIIDISLLNVNEYECKKILLREYSLFRVTFHFESPYCLSHAMGCPIMDKWALI